jgi:hypothetical protein
MNFVTSAQNQEALGYRLDAACAVRIYVDDEFERGRVATLARLGRRRYSSAGLAYDKALKAMDGSTPDTLAGVRGVFEATEEVFRSPRIITVFEPKRPAMPGAADFQG